MSVMPFVLLLAGLGPAPDRPGVALPAQTRGEVTARLWVRVPEQAAAPGLARVRWELVVEGPVGLEVDGPRLEDALDGWRWEVEASAWSSGRVEWSGQLVQAKPGMMPLPGLTLRVRPGPDAAWQEMGWHEVLQEPRDGPAPMPLAPVPERNWRGGVVSVAIGLSLLGAGAVAGWWFWRVRAEPPLSPREAALRALSAPALSADGRGAAHVAVVLRELVERQFGAPATRQTTEELVVGLRDRGVGPERVGPLLQVLNWCDQARFAGGAVEAEQLLEAVAKARAWVGGLSKSGEDGASGKVGGPGESG